MRLTPRYFARLTKEHVAARERSECTIEFMLAQVTSMIANTGFKGWDKPRQTDEFMPSRWSKEKPKERRQLSRKANANAIRTAMLRLCG